MPAPQPSRFTLVGAGAVASALGPLLTGQGWRAIGVFGRTPESQRAARLAGQIGGDAALALDAACQASDLVILAVPDARIGEVAQDLADSEVSWRGKTVMHLSGMYPSALLRPLAVRGADTLAAHPLQSFAARGGVSSLDGVYVTLEGTERARTVLRGVLSAAGCHPLTISEGDKAAIHTAASVLSNFLVTLAGMSREIAATTSLSEQEVGAMFVPLLLGTSGNVAALGADRALTGPIVRGDRDTVEAHTRCLAARAPHLLTAYVAMATETVRLARSTARLTGSDAMEILDVIVEALPVKAASDE